jgi:DNA-binding NtrC family response regulator
LTITLPALRQRPADLRQLSRAILDELGSTLALTEDASSVLRRHAWPGNIRELRNALKLAAIAAAGEDAIGAECFQDLMVAGTEEPTATPVAFSARIREAAQHLWSNCEWPVLATLAIYERRATQRAALLCLAVTHGRASLPTTLNQLWFTLFGPRWATSENGRGLRDVLRALGCVPSDQAARAWILVLAGQ